MKKRYIDMFFDAYLYSVSPLIEIIWRLVKVQCPLNEGHGDQGDT